jgi:hypothetical protein
MGDELYERYLAETRAWTDETVYANLGSWIMLSEDGQTWSLPVRVPVTAPHGPIRQESGRLLYLGKAVATGSGFHKTLQGAGIQCHASADEGRTWTLLGEVPLADGTEEANYHEPHLVELPSGKLVGLIRYQHSAAVKKHHPFTIFQSESLDGGRTWSQAWPTGVKGSPPHLLLHSSGAVVCVYGRREQPYGERAMISYDGCQTWQQDFVLRDDGPDSDLGYPASVELPDGSIFTLYYQKYAAGEKTSLLWTRWELP